MSESFNEEVEAFLKACNYVRLKPPGPDKIRVPTVDETRALQEAVIKYLGYEIDEVDWAAIEEKLEKKGNKPVDKEKFSRINVPVERVEVDVEVFVQYALELQAAVVEAEKMLKDAQQQWDDTSPLDRPALELRAAVIDAEKKLGNVRQQCVDAQTTLAHAQQQWAEIETHLTRVRKQRDEAAKTLEERRVMLNKHLEAVRGLNVTVSPPPDWGQNVYKVGERDA